MSRLHATADEERGAPAVFVVESGQAPIRSTAEYEEQLRKRLRVALAIWCVIALALATTATLTNRELIVARPSRFFTQPPLPGVLLLVAAAALALIASLAPHRRLGLRRLRAVEWTNVALAAAFFGLNQTVSLLAGTAFDIRENAMDLGAGLGAPWGASVLAFGALAPSSARHCLLRTAVLAACAFVPELIAFPTTIGWTAAGATYLAVKTITVGAMSALAIYGAHRIDILRRDVRAARELGSYVLRKPLGAGGMGEVFLAEHRFLRRPCAVKLIRPEQAGDEQTLARFEREVRAAARLTHPNTVQIYDYGRAEDGTFYCAMEYLPGQSLQELVDTHGPLPAARAVHVVAQLCRALREAHESGLVHRDLKPSNVMVTERGLEHDVAKLLDYGLVVSVRESDADARLTQAGMVVGTPAYMSPEQCAGDADVAAASDIYSLGAVMYFALTGRAPFGGRAALQMLAAHLYETPAPVTAHRRDVPAALSACVARALEKSPSARFLDVESFGRALVESVAPHHVAAAWDTSPPSAPSAPEHVPSRAPR